jgi:hypothetical protein
VFSDISVDIPHRVHHTTSPMIQSSIPQQDYYGVPRNRRPPLHTSQQRPNQNCACFNCGSSAHLLRNCPTLSNIKHGVIRHLKHRQTPSEVLHSLSDELADAFSEPQDEINVDEELSKILESTELDPNGPDIADTGQHFDVNFKPEVDDSFF